MKACSKFKGDLAALAVDGLAPADSTRLRAHLTECQHCRAALAELQLVSVRLRAARPLSEIEAGERFHRGLAARLAAPEQARVIDARPLFSWKFAAAAAAAALIFLFVKLNVSPQKDQSRNVAEVPSREAVSGTPPPTMAAYQLAANLSMEKLDELLSRQAAAAGGGALAVPLTAARKALAQ